MIRNPIDIAGRVSPELSNFIQIIIDRLESDEPVTLGAVRSFISNDMPSAIYETEEMHHFDVEESLVDELDELIEGFGESAAAVDFISATVSEALSRVIEGVINDENRDNVATLGDIREEILNGLPSRLVGDGVMDEEEDDQLLPEIDNLIERNGEGALAEEFLRYE